MGRKGAFGLTLRLKVLVLILLRLELFEVWASMSIVH